MTFLKRLLATLALVSLASPAAAQISGYSTTASSNTSVGGVSIAEGMAPGNVNDAIRAVMADLASYYSASGQKFTSDVGIGVSPGAKLDVLSSSGTVARFSTSGATVLTSWRTGSTTARGYIGSGTSILTGGSASDFGIGSEGDIVFAGTGGAFLGRLSSGGSFFLGTGSFVAGTDVLVLSKPATSGILSSVVATTAVDHARFYNGNGQVGGISTSGTATTFATSSDARLKANIQPSGEAGALIDALKVRQFDWKADGSHQDFGFVAQELDEVAPYAVTRGETWGVDNSKLVPLLVKEIQSLRARVAALEAQ